jgi:Inner membrane protein YgaP-like, transmembrane domain
MKSNVSTADRIIRVMIAAIVAVLYFTNTITGTWGILLMVAAAIILLTSVINFCPIYFALHLSTNKKNPSKHVQRN